MPWTAPRTWVSGETSSASVFNQHVRDNLLFLHDSRVSTLPTSNLVDQDEVVYIADASARLLWRLKYYSSGPSGKKWEAHGASPLVAMNNAAVTIGGVTGPGSYVSTGISLTVPLQGEYRADHGAKGGAADYPSTSGYLTPKFGSAALDDLDGVGANWNTAAGEPCWGTSATKTLSASDAIVLWYKATSSHAAINIYPRGLTILAWPVRVN